MISVVFPAWNAAGVLPRLLAALAEQSEKHELVLVDADSADETAALARDAGAKVVSAPRRNRSLARNLGVEAARGDLIAFTDADCSPGPAWVAALESCLESAELAAGPVHVETGTDPNVAERFDRLWRYPQERYVAAGRATSANLGIRRDAFDSVGGYDERFHH